MEFIRCATVAEFAAGSSMVVRAPRFEIALFRVDDEFFALENCCPHQGGPIADGAIEGAVVVCPWHAWCFDLRTGHMTLGDFATIPRFQTRIEEGVVYVATEPEPE